MNFRTLAFGHRLARYALFERFSGGETTMRVLTISLLATSVAIGACGGGDTSVNNAANPVSQAAPERDSKPLPASRPVERQVALPAGTHLQVVLDTPVNSATSRVEDQVQAHVAKAIVADGSTIVPEGSRVLGVISSTERSGKVKGRAHVSVLFDTLIPRGGDEKYAIQTNAIGRTAEATKKADAVKIGAPAAGGAIVGGLIGGKKGALIGTAAGGGAGTAVVLSTRGKEVTMPKGTTLTLRLSAPVTITLRG
jgi:hypothetical protein